ncbi:ribonuclease P protein component [Actinopolyspora mzabensis]|uniref:ribonuclease P protein component n=1 Tax=Actinopolyspora mzabensis TaxID=995066 RepID=UPI000B830855|nr:ribonuclease P protein component [Actinopolyspora mzabensis]
MLPAAARLRRSQDFTRVVRRGRRAGRPRLVLHALTCGAVDAEPAVKSRAAGDAVAEPDDENKRGTSDSPPTLEKREQPRVGFVVSKAVGNAVVRHRVSRQLRHLMRDRLPALPSGTMVVVRALPPAAAATSAELGRDLDKAARRLGLPVPGDHPDGGVHSTTDPS